MSRFDEPPFAPQDEASVVSGIIESQYSGTYKQDYLEVYSPWKLGICSVDRLPEPHREILVRSCQRAEARLQQIKPRGEGYYLEHHLAFINHFIAIPGNVVLDTEHVLTLGPRLHADQVLPLILARREDVVRISGREPEKFIVFMGSGETMERRYRSIGSSGPPYAYALTGALDCFLNTDYLGTDRTVASDAAVRAVWHEPAHLMWTSVLGKDMALVDIIVHEMLGGPLDPALWPDVEMPYHHPESSPLLDREVTYAEWLAQDTRLNGCAAPWFDKPAIKDLVYMAKNLGYVSLYRYALGERGDIYKSFSRVW